MNKSAVGFRKGSRVELLNRSKVSLVETHKEMLKALKEAKEVIYATINKRPASLTITWHTINDAISKAEGREGYNCSEE